MGECWTKKDQQWLYRTTVIAPVWAEKSRSLLCLFEDVSAERMAPVLWLLIPAPCFICPSPSQPSVCLSIHAPSHRQPLYQPRGRGYQMFQVMRLCQAWACPSIFLKLLTHLPLCALIYKRGHVPLEELSLGMQWDCSLERQLHHSKDS